MSPSASVRGAAERDRDVPVVAHDACANCAFWRVWWSLQDEEQSAGTTPRFHGYCRRYPPIYDPGRAKGEAVMDDDTDSFPSTDHDEWCGEYRSASSPAAQREGGGA